ncbi:MAG: hypothetical protein P8Z36_06875 [Gemmatimonadota bacterium]|jgi:starch-binding outer membrane protein, SusD/RagB family
MRTRIREALALAVLAIVALSGAACSDLLDVKTPDTIAANTVDPVEDAATFANSAWQNFVDSHSTMVVYTAWFTNELRVGDTFPTRNEFGRRFLDDRQNGTLSGDVWDPLARAVASAEDALALLQPELGDNNVSIARLYLASAFSTLDMAEAFCTGVVRQTADAPASPLPEGSPELTRDQMLAHVIARFQQAISSGTSVGTSEGTEIANAARIGLARANLFAGNSGDVAGSLGSIPAGFEFDAVYVDDPSNRGRLGNDLHSFSSATALRESGVVGPEWRALGAGQDISGDGTFTGEEAGDARVTWEYDGRLAQDGVFEFVYQTSHPGWDAPLVVASELEAQYLIQEATGTDASRIALINQQRTAAGQPTVTAGDFADSDAILEELLYQKGLDFWLTGRRMPDWRWYTGDGATTRSTHYRFIIRPTDDYYKPAVGVMGSQVCFPLPYNEYSRNPDINR